ncbi:hypothetical protein FQN54_009309 [Arachnomyces sp. PD_36]|nr:hypothetical protein FQN54_009309 [Arachnomyces sp. PD_36]
MLSNDLVPRSLLLIVLATSLRCLDPQNARADIWADECRNLVTMDIFTRISTANLQTLLLLQRYEWHRGAHIGAWFIAALATRLAQTLQLNDEPSNNRRDGEPALPTTVMETRRRLIWSCFVMDSIPDAGARPLSASFDPTYIKANLPCSERLYLLGVEAVPNNSSTPGNGTDRVDLPKASPFGASAFVIKLAILRMRILQYTSAYHPRNKSNLPLDVPWEPGTPFYEYQKQLDSWLAELPKELQQDVGLQDQNNSDLISLLNLHCMFHAAYADLWRIGSFVLANSRNHDLPTPFPNPPKEFLQHCKRGRFDNALGITGIAAKCLAHLTLEPDPFIAICGCLAVRVLVIERRPDDNNYLSLTDDDIRNRIDTVIRCVKKTARWSRPVWKMLLAVSELTTQHGYRVDLTGIPSLSSPMASRPISRAASPSLRTYGTYGTIQRSLATGTDELPPKSAENVERENLPLSGSSNNTPEAAMAETRRQSESQAEGYLPASEPLSPETLQLESSWADGTYDRAFTEAQFDWPDGNYGLDTNYNWMYSPFENSWMEQ